MDMHETFSVVNLTILLNALDTQPRDFGLISIWIWF